MATNDYQMKSIKHAGRGSITISQLILSSEFLEDAFHYSLNVLPVGTQGYPWHAQAPLRCNTVQDGYPIVEFQLQHRYLYPGTTGE